MGPLSGVWTHGRRPALGRWAIIAIVLLLAIAAPGRASAQASPPEAGAVVFDPPTAQGSFGEPVTFRTRFEADEQPERVELVSVLPGERVREVTIARVEPLGDGAWEATVVTDGHIVPNTRFDYHFRAVTEAGEVTGPEAEHRVSDDRVDWRTVERDGIRLSWYEGDEAFAERALSIADGALTSASELLGVERGDPVDVFVYGDTATFRSAMGPGTRENVGGQAHPAIRTLFGLIEPSQIGSDWVDELVRHELTHLVFDDAARSPYAYPPRWLNEGIAVYLSRGIDAGDRAQVEAATRGGTIIPLEGLDGQFPTRARRFSLAYAESASAVTYLVEAYGDGALRALVEAYAAGLGTDAAFRRALGVDLATFAAGWLESVGSGPIEPTGPRPAPPGPVPAGWRSSPAPLIR